MHPSPEIDEATTDLLLAATPTPADHELAEVVGFLSALRDAARMPPAPPSGSLATLLRAGSSVAPGPPAVAFRRPARWRRVLASGAAALALTGGGITVAAAANLLPDAIAEAVGPVVESLTPFDVPVPGRPSSGSAPDEGGPVVPAVGAPPSSPARVDNVRPVIGATVIPNSSAPSSSPATTIPVPAATVPTTAPSAVTAPRASVPTSTPPSIPSLPATTAPVSTPRPTLPVVTPP